MTQQGETSTGGTGVAEIDGQTQTIAILGAGKIGTVCGVHVGQGGVLFFVHTRMPSVPGRRTYGASESPCSA